MTYIERERQRTEALQQEQLDWLHTQHGELAEQTHLLQQIARHTRLQYVLTCLWLALCAVASVLALLVVLPASGRTAVMAVVLVAIIGWLVSAGVKALNSSAHRRWSEDA